MSTDRTRRRAVPAEGEGTPHDDALPAPRDPLGADGRPLRHFSTYTSVNAWYMDYHGRVPVDAALGISRLMKVRGISFADAYRLLLERGAIIQIVTIPEPSGEEGE